MKNKKGRITLIIIGLLVTIGGAWSIYQEGSPKAYFALVIPISGILLLMFKK